MNFVIVQAVNTSIVTKLIMLINTTKACISVHNNFHTTWATKTISFSLTTQCDTIQICVCNCVVLYGKQPNNQFYLEIDRYISQYLGFIDISVSAKTADIIGLNRSWQNAVAFLMHPDTLHKKAQRSKSKQLSYNNASRCGFINKQTRLTMAHALAVTTKTKASSGSFAMLEATTCRQVLCTNELPLYFRKF